jgi:hypothetical protein
MQKKYSQIFEFQQDLAQKWFVNYVGCWQLVGSKFQHKYLMFLAIDKKILIWASLFFIVLKHDFHDYNHKTT